MNFKSHGFCGSEIGKGLSWIDLICGLLLDCRGRCRLELYFPEGFTGAGGSISNMALLQDWQLVLAVGRGLGASPQGCLVPSWHAGWLSPE